MGIWATYELLGSPQVKEFDPKEYSAGAMPWPADLARSRLLLPKPRAS